MKRRRLLDGSTVGSFRAVCISPSLTLPPKSTSHALLILHINLAHLFGCALSSLFVSYPLAFLRDGTVNRLGRLKMAGTTYGSQRARNLPSRTRIHSCCEQSPVVEMRVLLRMRVVLATVVTVAVALTLSTAARAATIVVNSLLNTGTPGICVLRDAITAANKMTKTNGCAAGTGNDTIQFSVTGTLHLASTLPQVTDRRLQSTVQPRPASR